MKIHSLRIQGIEPFRDSSCHIPLSPHLTLIRGPNGVGKTTILEGLAMLGHCPLMEATSHCPANKCTVTFELSIATHESEHLGTHPVELENEKPVFLIAYHRTRDFELSDLKRYLSSELAISAEWCITALTHNPNLTVEEQGNPQPRNLQIVQFIQRLIEYSRPERLPPDSTEELAKGKKQAMVAVLRNLVQAHRPESQEYLEKLNSFSQELRGAGSSYSSTSRIAQLRADCESKLPGLVSYVNTDMYEWGIGLDIRESPKDQRRELPLLIRDRLHLVPGVQQGDPQSGVLNSGPLRQFWNSIFSNPIEKRARQLDFVGLGSDNLGSISIDGKPRDFLSSGENQVLFIGLLTKSLRARNSILLLDEPELHISLAAARYLYDHLYRSTFAIPNAWDTENQLVVVSHLPFVFKQNIARHEGSDPGYFVINEDPGRTVGLVCLPGKDSSFGKPLFGNDALIALGNQYNQELEVVINQMRLPEDALRLASALPWLQESVRKLTSLFRRKRS